MDTTDQMLLVSAANPSQPPYQNRQLNNMLTIAAGCRDRHTSMRQMSILTKSYQECLNIKSINACYNRTFAG
jgi:hypothetical protein